MCGIVAVFDPSGTVEIDPLAKAAAAMKHRGPDKQLCWLATDRTVGLAHARLSIIDIDGGDQPLHNEDGTIHAVVNGEIYDFERIRHELLQKGHQLATKSDSEVLIHLYEDYGLDALHHLRGEFAFVLYDQRSGRLVAARDRFGIKPLSYTWQQGTLMLASEVKALFAAGIPAAWDEEGVYTSCFLGGALPSRSLFRHVSQIPAGHVMVVSNSGMNIHKYWDFDYPLSGSEPGAKWTTEESIANFHTAFEEAVRLRLRADVPVGVYLSGGLDSCAILGMANKLRGGGVEAFTLRFDHENYDEGPIAEEMARHAGAKYHEVMVTQQSLADHFIEAVCQSETLMYNSHGVAKFMLSQTVHDHGFKVVLTGEGSDEIFAGYRHFQRDLEPFFAKDYTPAASDSFGAIRRRLGFVPTWIDYQYKDNCSLRESLRDDFLARFTGFDPYAHLLDEFDFGGQLKGRHPVSQSMYLWSRTVLPIYLLTVLGDRMEMGHAIEGRVPFLDHKVVEFATKLPVSMKISNQREKHILREAVQPLITNTVYGRQKHPFSAPPSFQGKKEPFYDFIRAFVCDNCHSLPFFDSNKIKKMIGEMSQMSDSQRQTVDGSLIALASTIALHQGFKL